MNIKNKKIKYIKHILEAYKNHKYRNAYNLLKLFEREIPDLYGNLSGDLINSFAAVKIQYGINMCNEDIIKDGLSLIEDNWDKIKSGRVAFNIANAYSELSKHKENYYEKIEYEYRSIYWYRIATKMEGNKAAFWVNYGNELRKQYRFIEALKIYDKALKIDENFGMAKVNKGELLCYLARFFDDHQREILLNNGYYLIKKALKEDKENILEFGGPRAIEYFKNVLNNYKKYAGSKEIIPEECPNFKKIPVDYKIIEGYPEFCFENDLWLNLIGNAHKCYYNLKDLIVLPNPGKSEKRLVDSIFESYATSRFLCFYSKYKCPDILNSLTNFNNNEYSLRNGMIKAAFVRAFSVLDYIAHFIYRYFFQHDPKSNVYFWNVFKVIKEINEKREEISKQIYETPLKAIYSLSRDFLNENDVRNAECIDIKEAFGAFADLRKTRDNLTHSGKFFFYNELYSKTLKLLEVVRSAIFYLYNYLYYLKKKKE